jgi:O-glycosyl hydrolase
MLHLISQVLGDPQVRKFVSGIAVHWYFDFLDVGGQKLSDTHYEFPDKFLLYTEASVSKSLFRALRSVD